MCPRKLFTRDSALWRIEQTGDSSTALRMTGRAIIIHEGRPLHVCRYCHPWNPW